MVNRSKEIRLAQRHPQGRHLQTGKPKTQRCRDALFGEDALKHHCDNLDRRPLCRGVSSAFEQPPGGLAARLQFQQLLRHRHVLRTHLDDRLAPGHILLMLNRRGQPRRGRPSVREPLQGHRIEARHLPADRLLQPMQELCTLVGKLARDCGMGLVGLRRTAHEWTQIQLGLLRQQPDIHFTVGRAQQQGQLVMQQGLQYLPG